MNKTVIQELEREIEELKNNIAQLKRENKITKLKNLKKEILLNK